MIFIGLERYYLKGSFLDLILVFMQLIRITFYIMLTRLILSLKT